jgi:hypothetical protein
MQNTAQAWFTGGPTAAPAETGSGSSSSLLSDWNSYAASRSGDESGAGSSALGFDIEAAVRTANDKVTGTFSV